MTENPRELERTFTARVQGSGLVLPARRKAGVLAIFADLRQKADLLRQRPLDESAEPGFALELDEPAEEIG